MKRILPFFIFVLLIFSGNSLARQENKNHLVIGLTFFTPYTTGTTEGPKTVINIVLPELGPNVFNDAFQSNALFRLSLGIRIDQLRTSFFVSLHGSQIREPVAASGSDLEFSCRYLFWEHGLANLSGIISLKRSSYINDSAIQHRYTFDRSFWLPGIGLSANFSVVHSEVQLHGWPGGTVIGYAAEPNGIPPSPFTKAWYDKRPIYLKYTISVTIGIEFDVFSF
jgi:hypothetical protein